MSGTEVSDYKVDFDTEISTSAHDFKVASNWGHIVHKYTQSPGWDFYMSYSYQKGGGVGGSNALMAYKQEAGDYDGTETTYDLLVTPVVSGTISLKAKAYNGTAFVEFYSLNETGTKHEELLASFSPTKSDFNTGDYATVSFEVDDPQRIGIRVQYAYIDDFSAQTAEIEPEKSIQIVTADPSNTSGVIYWDQQADKSVKVEFTNVTVTNNGEADLVQGEKNFAVSIINGNNKAVLGRANVPQNLAIGETSEPFTVTASIPADQISTLWSYSSAQAKIYLMENLQGSIVQRANSMYRPYESKFYFQDINASASSTSSLSGKIDFGMTRGASSKQFKIKNDGAAPLQMVSVTVTGGFATDLTSGAFEVAPHTETPLTVTMTDEAGAHNGTLQVVYKDNNGADKTLELTLTGSVLGESTWGTEFKGSDNNSDIVYPAGSVAQNGIIGKYENNNGVYNPWLTSYTNADYAEADNMFITPLLNAHAGETLTFDVARSSDASDSKYNLKVYISSDRVNWGEPVAVIGYDDLPASGYENHSITFPAEGNYYVGFAVYGVCLDNIMGAEQAHVEKDLYLYTVKQTAEIQSGDQYSASIEVIAPLGVSASDYSVKYYMNGEVAASIEPIDMSADSKTKKTFDTGYFNPTVEQTSVLPTYFEFAFSDGTVFTSPVQELTVTNNPVFVFFDAGTATGSSKPANRTSAIDFGVTNTLGTVQHFEIFNWGTAPLTVKSVSVSEGFSVNVGEATVAAKERQAVDVTFSAETPGTFEGELEVVYVTASGEDATFSLAVKGTLLDPAKWYASFDNPDSYSSSGVFPAGSLYQNSLSASKGADGSNYYLYGSGGTSNIGQSMFITPLLKATAGETISFRARTYAPNWPEGVVEVYAAKTRDELADADARISLGKWSGKDVDSDHLLTPEFRTVEATIEEAGEYYLGFVLYSRTMVDDIYGLSPVAVAHDVIISAAEIATTAMQNRDAAASITLQNVGLNTEAEASYIVAVYVDGVKCNDVDGIELPVIQNLSTAGVKNEVLFRSPKTGTFPVYIEVDFGDGYAVTTEPVDVTFEEETLSSEITVGTPSGTQFETPLYLNYRYSESVTLYTPADLGLAGGEKIKSIVIRGYGSSAHTTAVTAAYEWTDDQTQAKPSATQFDTSNMTECLNEPTYEWDNSGNSNNLVDLITITFNEPLEYEAGKSLRLFFKSSATGYKQFYFEKSTIAGGSYEQHNDNALNGSWNQKNNPVLHLTLEVESRTFAPTVVDTDGNAVAGATVTLISNDGDNVQYEGTTGEDGTCSLNVIQSGRTYDVEVKSEAGEAYLEGVSVAETSFEGEIILLPVLNITDESVHTGGNDATVVYLNTVFTPGFNAVALPFALDAEEVTDLFGADCMLMEFTGETVEGNEVRAHFSTVTTGMEAGKPYLVFHENTTEPTRYNNKTVVAELGSVEKDVLSFTGATQATPLTDGMHLLTTDNYEHTGTARSARVAETVKPYQAYMRVKDPNITAVSFDSSDDIVNGIEGVATDTLTGDEVIYNLQGVRVSNPAKGNIYIVNGKAVVIK